VKRALLWVIIAAVLLIAFVIYLRRSQNHLDVTPDAQRAIDKARGR
jgi:hypothetical protein